MTAPAIDIAPRTGAARFNRSWLLLVVVGSMAVRFTLADRAIWDTDEGANLWMASQIVAGDPPVLGQPSSQGVRNLPGAPWLMAPFALLPDLSSVSWALTAAQLLGLTLFALALGGPPADRVLALAALALLPSTIGASYTPFNQYLCLTLDLFLLAALLRLLAGTDSSRMRSLLAVTVAALSLLQPAVHLAYVPDCLIRLLAQSWALRRRPGLDRHLLVAGLLMTGAAVSVLLYPWLAHELDALLALASRRIGLLAVVALLSMAVALLAVAAVRARTAVVPALPVDRIVFRFVPALALLVIGMMTVATPLTRKALGAHEWPAFLLAAAQIGLVLCFAPVALRGALGHHGPGVNPDRHLAACLLGSIAGGSFLCRLVMSPAAVLPSGRLDLLVSLVPAFVGALLLAALATPSRAPRIGLAAASGFMLVALAVSAAVPLSPGFWQRHGEVVPASDMQAATAALAAHHRLHGGVGVVDVAYDLNLRREWIPAHAQRAGEPVYTIGRSLDWLLWRAHGLRNEHEGEYRRDGPSRYRLSLPEVRPSPNLHSLARAGRLTLWGPADTEAGRR